MKVICSKDNLSDAINVAQKAVSTKSTLPILEGLLLEAGKNFKITGNDLEMGIECCIDADIMEKGSIVINARMLGDIVRRMPDSDVLIEVRDDNMVIIECENSHFEIKGLSPSGFVALPEIVKENAFRISQKLIKDMVKQTIFAVSLDENRPILTGSLIECSNGEITFVSIDGFRVALRKNKIEEANSNLKVVVPGKTLNEIAKILQPVDDELAIYSTNNQILFEMENCKIVSRLLEGEYLNYRSTIPDDYETKITVNTKDLLSSLERASLIIASEERRYPVILRISDEKIVINSNTEMGTVREEVNIELDGKELEIAFNPRYLIDSLKAIDDENLSFYFTTNIGPATMKSCEGDNFSYMILPVRR